MYRGIIIEESLKDRGVLDSVRIVGTEIETVTSDHETPWLKEWTLDVIEIDEKNIEEFATKLQSAIETDHTAWYADMKNSMWHYIIFPKKIFRIDRSQPKQYEDVRSYGLLLGLPEHQLDFSSQIA